MVILTYGMQGILLILALGLLWYQLNLFVSIRGGAPYITTTHTDVNRALKLAHISKTDVVYDLGSGDGRLLFAAAQLGATARGIEINLFLVIITLLRTRLNRLNRISIIHKSVWDVSVSDATVVFIYLLPSMMPRLEKKLLNELCPGTTVITRGFPLPTLKPIKTESSLFLYKI